MAGIDDLITTFMAQAQEGQNAAPAPWQQELLETVNPAKVKKQNIARALAQASTAMATTPGNFLSGISAAAATGANSYLTGKDQAEDQRIKVQQLVQMQQQKDQDRRLSLLLDAIGVGRNQIQDKQSAESHTADMEYKGAQTEYYKGRGTGSTASDAAIERKKGQAATAYYKWLDDYKESNYGEEPAPEVQDQRWNDILRRFGIPDGGTPDATTQPSPSVTQPPAQSGTPQTPAPTASGSIRTPPTGAVEMLRKNPALRDQFDAKYGSGAAASILGN